MLKTYRFRIYPTAEQIKQLEQHFRETRMIYNRLVERSNTEQPFKRESSTSVIKELRQDHLFLQNTPSVSYKYVLNNFHRAHQRCILLNRKLKYKSAHGRASFSLINRDQAILVDNKAVSIKGIGRLRAKMTRLIKGNILLATIVKTGSERYYMSILTKQPENKVVPLLQKEKLRCIGLDMGITHFLVRSDGQRIENPRYYQQNLQRLRRLQKDLARKQRGSANYRKQQIKIARFHESLVNRRNAFLHRESSKIVQENDIIVVEKLGIQDLLGDRRLSLQISDASWYRFLEMLAYKSQWYGKRMIQIDRYAPTTRTCCRCRSLTAKLPLQTREWHCPQCDTFHDRDINAAINIMIEGAKIYMKEHPQIQQKLIPVLSDRR
ncbi:MAG: RNA-guided endonuclease InsQ/TnpB family protein [Saccharofermentanales bacterium]|jgi:putative transposase